MQTDPLETLEGQDFPSCRQISIFLENRLGQLLRVTRLLDDEPVHILGMSVDASVDCAIVRMLVDNPDLVRQILVDASFPISISEVLVVELPVGKRGIITICGALISGEVNINYVYTVWAGQERRPCLAIQVDNVPVAVRALLKGKFTILQEHEL
ncbi:MAG: hypothetical protein IPM13_13325 [Phycisphaerales bacterium]|nr:hypothetical protein [Phycisphaerales bacterium]